MYRIESQRHCDVCHRLAPTLDITQRTAASFEEVNLCARCLSDALYELDRALCNCLEGPRLSHEPHCAAKR
jgi:hypothetical protein